MNKKEQKRLDAILPNGIPRYIRCYDSGGETIDRYTVVFTGHYTHNTNGSHLYLGMSAYPFDPQGFGQHGESDTQIDRPAYGHLGKKIKFIDLPKDCQTLVLGDYISLWDLFPQIQAEGKKSQNLVNPYPVGSLERIAFHEGVIS